MGRKHWKTIYKELQKPMHLSGEDGDAMCIIGTYSRGEAFDKIKKGLVEWYGKNQPEYENLTSLDQLKVAFLRRPNEDDSDMDVNFVAEQSREGNPRENDVWIYYI